MKAALAARVLCQDHAIETVVPVLERIRAGDLASGRPLAVFLFLGPTGVGKTELAQAISDLTFGTKEGTRNPYLIQVNCGNLTEDRDIVQLLGAPKGLVGYKAGTLTNGLRQKGSRVVVVFDTPEKAHKSIWRSLWEVFDRGLVTEADGTTYDVTGSILIATSNCGCHELAEDNVFTGRPSQTDRDKVWKWVSAYFSPELLHCFGRESVVYFQHLDRAAYRTMIENQAAALVEEMTARGLHVSLGEGMYDTLCQMAWEKRNEGARPVRRLINSYVRDLIVERVTRDAGREEFHFVWRNGEDYPAVD